MGFIMTSINHSFYEDMIKPVFAVLGWQGHYQADWENETVMLLQVTDAKGQRVDHGLVKGLIDMLIGVDMAAREDAKAGAPEGEKAGKPEVGEPADPLPPIEIPIETKESAVSPFMMDCANFSERDRGYLMAYQKWMIVVEKSAMKELVFPVFEICGWRYGGTSYGNGTFGFGWVIDENHRIVSPYMIKRALALNGVEYNVYLADKHEPEPEGEAEKAGEPESERAGERESEKAGEEPSPSHEKMHAICLETAEPVKIAPLQHTIQLAADQKVSVQGYYDGMAAHIGMVIGEDRITFIGTFRQGVDFFTDAATMGAKLFSDIIARAGNGLEGKEGNGESESGKAGEPESGKAGEPEGENGGVE